MLATSLPPGKSFFSRMRIFTSTEIRKTQKAINQANENFYENAFSFATLILPIIDALGTIFHFDSYSFPFLD